MTKERAFAILSFAAVRLTVAKTIELIKIKFSFLEKYSRGRRGAPAKGVGRVTGARVQIPLSP